jgi:hypothetical protein
MSKKIGMKHDEYVYDENVDEFVLIHEDNKYLLERNGNRIEVETEVFDDYEMSRYALHIDDFGYVIAAMVRLFRDVFELNFTDHYSLKK